MKTQVQTSVSLTKEQLTELLTKALNLKGSKPVLIFKEESRGDQREHWKETVGVTLTYTEDREI
jgi:hypothetical protein